MSAGESTATWSSSNLFIFRLTRVTFIILFKDNTFIPKQCQINEVAPCLRDPHCARPAGAALWFSGNAARAELRLQDTDLGIHCMCDCSGAVSKSQIKCPWCPPSHVGLSELHEGGLLPDEGVCQPLQVEAAAHTVAPERRAHGGSSPSASRSHLWQTWALSQLFLD